MKGNLDLNTWITQQALADELGFSVQRIHNWVQRNKIEWQRLPNSKIILVNKKSISIDNHHHKNK